jgi:hypothetical protein
VKSVLSRILAVVLLLPAIGFLITGLRFAVAPAGAVKGLEMPLLEGAARSSQIGDVGALFLGMGLMILTALVTRERVWFVAPAILLGLVAVLRLLAWLLHDAALLMNMIVPEILIASLLFIASSTLVREDRPG